MKRRGINVATFNDESSTSIWLEAVVLVTIYVVLNLCIFGVLLITSWRQKPSDKPLLNQETLAAAKGLAKLRTSQNSGNVARLSEVASGHEFAGDLHMDLAFLEELMDDDDDDDSSINKHARIDMAGVITSTIREEDEEEEESEEL